MMKRSPVTTHVLDTATGQPAAGVPVELSIAVADGWTKLAAGVTNNDGRVGDLLPVDHVLVAGVYKMRFDTGVYFAARAVAGFYPYAEIVFEIRELSAHYHIPLLLSPFGYSTYRGS